MLAPRLPRTVAGGGRLLSVPSAARCLPLQLPLDLDLVRRLALPRRRGAGGCRGRERCVRRDRNYGSRPWESGSASTVAPSRRAAVARAGSLVAIDAARGTAEARSTQSANESSDVSAS